MVHAGMGAEESEIGLTVPLWHHSANLSNVFESFRLVFNITLTMEKSSFNTNLETSIYRLVTYLLYTQHWYFTYCAILLLLLLFFGLFASFLFRFYQLGVNNKNSINACCQNVKIS